MIEKKGSHGRDSRRRWLAAGVGWPVLAWVGALPAQTKSPVVIGWLSMLSRERHRVGVDAFNEGMAALGWKLGSQYVLEERHADGHVDRLPALAQELAALRPAVIVALPSELMAGTAVPALAWTGALRAQAKPPVIAGSWIPSAVNATAGPRRPFAKAWLTDRRFNLAHLNVEEPIGRVKRPYSTATGCSMGLLRRFRAGGDAASPHLGTRQYARIVDDWVEESGLDPNAFGTHSMHRTKPTLIYRRTRNLRAVQLLAGHTKLESTVRYLGIDVDDALEIDEQTEV